MITSVWKEEKEKEKESYYNEPPNFKLLIDFKEKKNIKMKIFFFFFFIFFFLKKPSKQNETNEQKVPKLTLIITHKLFLIFLMLFIKNILKFFFLTFLLARNLVG